MEPLNLLANTVSSDDLSIIGWVVALFCIIGAGVAAWAQNWLATGLLIVVAVFAVVLLT